MLPSCHSPVSGTSPSPTSPALHPLPVPPASSAASSPSAPLASPAPHHHQGPPLPPQSLMIVSTMPPEGDSTSGAASGGRRASTSPSLGAAGDGNGGTTGTGNDVQTYLVPLSQAPEPEGDQLATTPLLSRYDPYHGTTCFVHHPFTQKPLSGEEVRESLQRALVYGACQLSERLNYHDLGPSIRGLEDGSLRSAESFRDLVEKGNRWLVQNPQYAVRTCESVTWCTTEQVHVGDTEAVVLGQFAHAQPVEDTIYLTGLRLWVVTRDQDAPCQQIRVRDFHPTDHESLAHLVRRVNAQLEESPCTGTILTIETVPYADVSPRDSDVTLWRESQCKQGIHTLFLRIFYVEGPTKQETIGIKDFCPEISASGSDPFGKLVKNAKRWVNDEKSIRLINFRSLYVTRHNDTPEESADHTTQQYYHFDLHQYFTVLRLFYARLPPPGVRAAPSGSPYTLLNYVTFTPVQLLPGESTEVEYEKMRQTMVRVSAWIKAAGANVLCCESVVTPLYPHIPTQSLPEITHWEPVPSETQISSNYLKKYLLHIRLYLEGDYTDPDPHALPPLPSSLTAALQATLLERERRHYRKKRKRRKRRRSVMIVLSAVILSVIIGIIVVDQSLNFFGL